MLLMDAQLNPYLAFNGTCEEAMEFYKTVFGGELTISRFSDFNSPEMPVSKEQNNKVMHAMLRTDEVIFMASDSAPGNEVVFGDNISMSLSGPDDTKLSGYFESLSQDGSITMPLAKQVWGDKFGMVTDKFGVHWMVNIGMTK
jgi:PhnB protein